jgi:hypothetical protein
MNTIKIAKDSNELEFKNWQEVGLYLTGKNTPVSSDTVKKMLVKNGWELLSVEKNPSSKNKVNLIENLIKSLSVVDKDLIKDLQKQRETVSKNVKTSKDAQELISLNQKIEQLSNPSIDRDTFISKITSMYDDYITTDKEEA